MDTDSEIEPTRQSALWWLAIVALALAVYVLSSGPAVYLRERGYVSKQMVRVIYAPLIPVESASFESYIGWWVGKGRKR